jgi:hypothetical protein
VGTRSSERGILAFSRNNNALMKIVKLFSFWVLTIGTSALLLSGFVQAYDPDDQINPPTPQILPRDPAAGPTESAERQGAAGALKRRGSKAESAVSKQPQLGPNFGFGPKGLAFETADANPFLRMGARLQFRFATLQGDPEGLNRPEMQGSTGVTLRMDPTKLGGNPFRPWTGISLKHDLEERGFSSEQGLHLKEIDDGRSGSTRSLRGGSFQVGYLFPEFWDRVPGTLEITGRVSLVDPGTSVRYALQEEWTLGATWFSRGQRNKITADVSYRELDYPDAGESAARFQVRWDISF